MIIRMRGIMKALKVDWLAPLVGIAVVAGSVMAATTYVNLERRVYAEEALTVTLDNLYQNEKLSVALRALHDGQIDAAAQRMDLLLCQNVLRLDSQMSSPDPRTRVYVGDALRRIAQLRPRHGVIASGLEYTQDQAAAEQILVRALDNSSFAQSK
jgi:hypothetical protein